MSQPNRVMIALTSILAGAATGGAVAATGVWAAWKNFQFLNFLGSDPQNNTVFLGWGLGLVVAAVVSWRTSGHIVETWRRAAMGFTAGMGAVGCGAAAQGVATFSMMSMNSTSEYWSGAFVWLLAGIAAGLSVMSRKYRSAPAE